MTYKNSQDRAKAQKKYRERITQKDNAGITQKDNELSKKDNAGQETVIPGEDETVIPSGPQPITLTGLANIISTPQGKKKLDAILQSFEQSHNPGNMAAVRLGTTGPTLELIYTLWK